jgi:ribosomal protein L29
MDEAKLAAHIAGLEADLLAARKALADGSLPNPRVILKNRRDIARSKTILNEKINEKTVAAATVQEGKEK